MNAIVDNQLASARVRVLITGGAGFIGSHLAECLQGGAEVRVLDDLSSGSRDNLAGLDVELIQGSILDREVVRKAVKGVDYIFHLAAVVSVPESLQKPTECAQVNSIGTLIVLEEAARAGVKKLMFSSSAAIYGANPITPKIETMLPEPRSPYAVTKLDGEFYCDLFTQTGRLQTACLRYFNVFGPRQNCQSHYAAAVPAFINRAAKNESITIYGDGQQTRDFVYVKDVVAANVFFATQPSLTGVFNIAGGEHITINELAVSVCRLMNSASKIEYVGERPGDVKNSIAALDKLHASGFRPKTNFQQNLSETIQSYRKQLSVSAEANQFSRRATSPGQSSRQSLSHASAILCT